jgi:hypothetical protein
MIAASYFPPGFGVRPKAAPSSTFYLNLILVILAIFLGLIREGVAGGATSAPTRELIGTYSATLKETTSSAWRAALVEFVSAHDVFAEVELQDHQRPIETAVNLSQALLHRGVALEHVYVIAHSSASPGVRVRLWRQCLR